MKKTLAVALVLLTLTATACTQTTAPTTDEETNPTDEATDVNATTPPSDTTTTPTAQVDDSQNWTVFSNSNGGYSFKYSPTWNAIANQYNNKNSLFGVNASSKSGLGGVEVNAYTGTLEAYLNNMEQNVDVKYLNRTPITINGITGIHAEHTSSSSNGVSVYLMKGNQVFNISVNSKDTAELALFDKLVASFTLLN